MGSSPEYDYGIWHNREDYLHRGPMTASEARIWIDDWLDDGGRSGIWSIVRRPVGEWEKA